MKKKFTDILHTAGSEYSLSNDERAKMTRLVREYMSFKPLPHRGDALGDFKGVASISVSYRWFTFAHRPIAAALVLVLIFGSSVSYAAESALPGDALYTVKTYINEPARIALATNAEAKAEVQIELAERRIEEAAALAAEGRLDDDTQEELAAAFEEHAYEAASNIAETESEDDASASELASRFENRLAAHESILSEVEIETEEGEESERSHRLTDAIHATNMVLAEARFNRANVTIDTDVVVDVSIMALGATEDTTGHASSSTDEVREDRLAPSASGLAEAPRASSPEAKAISRMKSAAEKSLKNAEKKLHSAKSLSGEARAKAEADISLAGETLADGEEFLKDDSDAEAYAAFEESSRISEKTFIYIKAAPTLEKARERGRTLRSPFNSNAETNVRAEVKVEVSMPLPAVDATITMPILPTDDPKKGDRKDEDSGHTDGEDDHKVNPDPSPGSSPWFKIDLSL